MGHDGRKRDRPNSVNAMVEVTASLDGCGDGVVHDGAQKKIARRQDRGLARGSCRIQGVLASEIAWRTLEAPTAPTTLSPKHPPPTNPPVREQLTQILQTWCLA